MRRQTKARIALLFFIVLVMALLLAPVVEASVKSKMGDSWQKTKAGWHKVWDKSKIFIKSGAFWLNTLVIFAAIFLAVSWIFKDKFSDNTQKIMLYIIIGLVAIILATKLVDNTGKPEVIWKQNKFREATQFLIGPTGNNVVPRCSETSRWESFKSGVLVSFGGENNIECCGTGAYHKTIGNKQVCQQAILRQNENGSGLIAFILASVLMYLLLDKLLKESLSDETGKKIKIFLAILIGALMANDRLTKQQLLIVAGWAFFVFFALKMTKKYREQGEQEGGKGNFFGKMVGVAIPYALVQLVLAVFGTSLWGAKIGSSGVNFGALIMDLLFGCILGAIYAMMTGEAMGVLLENARPEKREMLEQMRAEGKVGRMLLSDIPGIGAINDWLWNRSHGQPVVSPAENRMNRLLREIETLEKRWYELLAQLRTTPDPQNAAVIRNEMIRIDGEKDRLIAEHQRLATGNAPTPRTPATPGGAPGRGPAPARPAPAARPPGRQGPGGGI